MSPKDVVTKYFLLSNLSDFESITRLFANSITYTSQHTGQFEGSRAVTEMQQAFHAKYRTKHWQINSMSELEPGRVTVDYDFNGEMLNGDIQKFSGIEIITIKRDKITSVEIKNK